jgi:copper chaperone CopZ
VNTGEAVVATSSAGEDEDGEVGLDNVALGKVVGVAFTTVNVEDSAATVTADNGTVVDAGFELADAVDTEEEEVELLLLATVSHFVSTVTNVL